MTEMPGPRRGEDQGAARRKSGVEPQIWKFIKESSKGGAKTCGQRNTGLLRLQQGQLQPVLPCLPMPC